LFCRDAPRRALVRTCRTNVNNDVRKAQNKSESRTVSVH
jgi:hypothetical protein